MFSSRLPATLAPNAISRTLDDLRARGVTLLDLTETNPTRVGLPYPPGLLDALADPRAGVYGPDPVGLRSAREAVAAGDPNRTILTTSTSEAYALLFKLLCNPGDVVLAPRPSYPLFESLSALEAVGLTPYWLQHHGEWSIDRDSLTRNLTACTRAVMVVSPNNPTGSMLRQSDRDWLASLCAERDLAIISDEVFADYPLRAGADAVSFAGETRALTFVLGGLSKSAGLPQVKLGWIAVSGPDALVSDAMVRLELICDTYLSVSTPVQLAAPQLIAAGAGIREAIRTRVTGNLSALEQMIRPGSPVSLLTPEGGWSAVLRVPATRSEESLVLDLLRNHHVIVHPGFFYDFGSEAFLVVSLLPEPEVFAEGMQRVLPVVEAGHHA